MTESIRSGSRSEKGFTFVELIMGTVIIILVSTVLIANLLTTFGGTKTHRDKVFAYSVAQSILAELHALAEGAVDPDSFDVFTYHDASTRNPVLTLARNGGVPVLADSPHSGNIQRQGQWLWSRNVRVQSMPQAENRNLRYVTVSVFKRDAAGIDRQVASLSSVVNSAAGGYASSQAFDVYLLALESVPGWWVNMEAVNSFVESTLSDLESRNPGLELRAHWITKASYGRNQVYRPYLNVTADTLQNIPEVYFYPGRMPAGGAVNFYYAPERFKARIATDSGQINGYDATLNPHPYAVSDFYNHAMRLPEERALNDRRVAEVRKRKQEITAAILAGNPPPPELNDMSEEPTLRLLLEDMNTDPDKYRHAIVINLHGELIPVPAVRNYSDTAKLPRNLPDVRVVTHPEQIRTERPTVVLPGEDVVLRVYAYTQDPLLYTGPGIMPDTHLIQVEIPGIDLTVGGGPGLQPGVEIKRLAGGVMVGGTDDYTPFTTAKIRTDPMAVPDEMTYWAQLVDDGPGQEKKTVIWFYETPVISPDKISRGLKNTLRSRLYNLEYVPAPIPAGGNDFGMDLSQVGDGPKNTARWTVKIPKTVFATSRFLSNFGVYYDPAADVMLTVRTRIWDTGMAQPWTSGAMYPVPIDPENLSVTYTWWADSREDVPLTERSQFLGDPRHNPYKDLLDGDPDFPNGYNWYHDALDNNGENSVADYPGLDAARLENRWNARIRADVPRLFEMFRKGLVESATVYTSLTGWSYYYWGIGNDMGADSNMGYPDSLPMDLRPYGNPGLPGFINNITTREAGGANTGGRRYIVDSLGHWYGMPWLGEFYPDTAYSTQWFALDGDGEIRGNLDAGPSANQFSRNIEEDTHANSPYQGYGTELHRSEQRAHRFGCTAFVNIGSVGSTFHHKGSNGNTGDLVGSGVEIAANYGIELPATTEINRPYDLDVAGSGTPPEFSFAPYSTERYSASLYRTYYDHSTGSIGSGLIQLTDPGNTSSAFLVINGLNPSLDLGTAEIAKFSILSTIHSFFEMGEPALAHRIPQTPKLTVTSPLETTELQNPSTIDVIFDVEWLRWDGLKYTTGTSPSFSENEAELEYVLIYSKDSGVTWYYMQDDTIADPDTKPTDPSYLEADVVGGAETYTWSVPAVNFPEGIYFVRVLAFRNNQNLHNAFHQVRCYIDR